MLIKASNLIHLPVFTLLNGEKLKAVEDVIYQPQQNRITALLIDRGGWFSKAKVIRFADVRSIGHDAVIIDSENAIKEGIQVEPDINAIAKSDTYLTGINILTEDGINLGIVTDIYINTSTGDVEEFEVTQKENNKNKSSIRRCKITDILTLGKDVAIVRVNSTPTITTTLKETIGAVGQTVSDTAKTLTQRIMRTNDTLSASDISTKLPTQATYTAPDTSSDLLQQNGKRKYLERRKNEVIGLYLTKNILTNDDKLIAKEGEMVTHRIIEDAQTNGTLDQVLDNVSQRMPLSL